MFSIPERKFVVPICRHENKHKVLTLRCGRARISRSSSTSPRSDSTSGEFWSNSRSASATSRHFCTASLGGARVGLTTLLEIRSYSCRDTQDDDTERLIIHTQRQSVEESHNSQVKQSWNKSYFSFSRRRLWTQPTLTLKTKLPSSFIKHHALLTSSPGGGRRSIHARQLKSRAELPVG